MIHLDFETKSAVDLIKHGTYRYAMHPTTDVNCFGWAIGDSKVDLWMPGDPMPPDMRLAIKEGMMIAAWNAQFERMIWNFVMRRYGFPALPIERFYCIAALSRARGFPGKLEKAARFAGIPYQKDMDGHYLMLKLCKPRRIEEDGTIVWWDDPEEHRRLGEYCGQDVEVERCMFSQFMPFTDEELSDYHLSEEINDRGVCVDVALCEAAVKGVEQEKITADDAIWSLTDGEVSTCNQVQKISAWVAKEWKELPSLGKGDINDALLEDDIPPHVADVLELRRDNAKSAVSKFTSILNHQINGVVQGGYLYRGAGQTGRYTSLGVQRHNMMRDSRVDAIPILMKHGIAGLRMLGDPIKLLSQMVRPAFVAADGRTFLIGDFAQIEARVTAWLANEEWLLKIFRVNGDPYCAFGTKAFKRPITKEDVLERFISKGCVLGLGFGGAEGALARTLKKEGNIVLPHAELSTHVKTYRQESQSIVSLWHALNAAVLDAMYAPGTIVEVSYVCYLFDGLHLWCKLPSGRFMCYPFAKIVQDEWGDSVEYRRGNRNPKSGVVEWPTVRLWHGIETENLAQAIAFDLLMGAMRRLRDSDIRLHVHDELVAEVDEDQAEKLLPVFLEVMSEVPGWAPGLPVHAEGGIRTRYQKI